MRRRSLGLRRISIYTFALLQKESVRVAISYRELPPPAEQTFVGGPRLKELFVFSHLAASAAR